MKRLLLIRHAKSRHDIPGLSDHDRPLNKRGQRDIETMAHWLAQNEPQLELILSSTAKRSLLLAELFAKLLAEEIHSFVNHQSPIQLETTEDLYTFSATAFLSVIKSLPDELKVIALVGHNPAITEVVNHLGFDISNVPTSGIVVFNCDVTNWRDVSQKNSILETFISPKTI